MSNKICVFSAADDSYAAKSAVSMLSIRAWQPDTDLFLIGRNFSNATKRFLKRYRITPIEVTYDHYFHTAWGNYPLECYYMFVGPELLHARGYSHSLYVDGDVYCNQDPFQLPLTHIKDFGGAMSKRSIRRLFEHTGKDDVKKSLELYGNESALDEPRIQTGVVYFNNESLAKKGFLKKIATVYQDAIDAGMPRKGDDSLLALFRQAYPDWGYLDTKKATNVVTFETADMSSKRWTRLNEAMINEAIFWHFNMGKPWKNTSWFPTYTYEYFYHKWRRRAIDVLQPDDLRHYFPAINATLSTSHLRFYWGETSDIGDLLTPYFLTKACGVTDVSRYRLTAEQVKTIERQQIDRGVLARSVRLLRKVYKHRHALPMKQAHYSIATSQSSEQYGGHALVYGGSIQRADQHVNRSLILAVRGPITRKRYLRRGYPCPPIYGELGHLLPRFYSPKIAVKYTVGIIPRPSEYDAVVKRYVNDDSVHVIDIRRGDVEQIVDEVLACKMTLSSSLYGLILSHAYAVPTRQIRFSDETERNDETEFSDYYSAIDIPRLSAVNAHNFKRLPLSTLRNLTYETYISVDTVRFEDALFFDADGFRASARYPYA